MCFRLAAMWVALFLLPLLLLFAAWAMAAIWIDGPASRKVAAPVTASFAVVALGLLVWGGPGSWGGAGVSLLCLCVLVWWLSLSPRSDREWEASLSRTATAEIDGDRLTFRNVRNFEYRSADDFTERWDDRTFRLSELRGMDLFMCFWGPRFIAHTIASWEFAGGRHIAISIEVRKVQGKTYSAIESFFRRFELHYVVSDERDVIRLRTDFRREDVYLYRLTIQRETALGILREYIHEMQYLEAHARWYNAVTRNCTTSIRNHVKRVSPDDPWDWRILVNGRLDEVGYERANIDTSFPFEELRRRSAISERALAAGGAPDFSRLIRVGLPGSPHPPPSRDSV
jgi:hypothetical protein